MKHQQKLELQKMEFHNKQLEKEKDELKKLRNNHCHFSDNSKEHTSSRYHSNNYPEPEEARKARHEHVCNVMNCGKIIPKGSFYYRRSFGQMWTIKVCSIKCFCEGLP